MLHIITSTGNKLLRNVNIDDPEWPWTPKIGGYNEFSRFSGCDTHFKSKLCWNGSR